MSSSQQQQQRQPSEEGEVVVVTGGTTVVEGDHAEEDQEEVSSANPDMSHVSVVVLGEASIQVIDSSLTTGTCYTILVLGVWRWDGVS